MTAQVSGYLGELRRQLHVTPGEEQEILHEIRDQIEDRARQLMKEGAPPEEAFSSALRHLGTSRRVASQLYEVHTQGSWHYTVLAALPHILLSFMFALGLWAWPGSLLVLPLLAVVISAIGWKKGWPTWTYPWLGYCLVAPLVSWGLAMSAIGYGAWGVLTTGALPLGIPIHIASFVYVAASL